MPETPDTCSEVDMNAPPGRRDDRVLIEMAVAGCGDCFAALMGRHLIAVRRKLSLMVSNQDDLDDLVQEVQLKAWRHLPTFRSESNIRTWMIRIGINQARQTYRHSRCGPVFQPLDESARLASSGESTHQKLLRSEATDALRLAVARLPRKYREVLVLRHLSELLVSETAAHLHKTVETVKTRLFRARRMLSQQLRGVGAWGGARGKHLSRTRIL